MYMRIGRISETGTFEVVYRSEFPLTPMPYPNTRSKADWETFLDDLRKGWGGEWENPRR
jgi:urea transport system substrate-binding protein